MSICNTNARDADGCLPFLDPASATRRRAGADIASCRRSCFSWDSSCSLARLIKMSIAAPITHSGSTGWEGWELPRQAQATPLPRTTGICRPHASVSPPRGLSRERPRGYPWRRERASRHKDEHPPAFGTSNTASARPLRPVGELSSCWSTRRSSRE